MLQLDIDYIIDNADLAKMLRHTLSLKANMLIEKRI